MSNCSSTYSSPRAMANSHNIPLHGSGASTSGLPRSQCHYISADPEETRMGAGRRNLERGVAQMPNLTPNVRSSSSSFPADSFDVKPHRAADPSPEYSSCLNEPHDHHYVSRFYDTSENPPLDTFFSPRNYSPLESLHHIASTTPSHTTSPSRITSAMNSGIPENTYYAYNSPPADNTRGIALEHTSSYGECLPPPQQQQVMRPAYSNQLYLPLPRLDNTDPYRGSYAGHPGVPPPNSLFSDTHASFAPSEMNDQLWTQRFIGDGGMSHLPHVPDLNVDHSRLQQPWAIDPRFYYSDSRCSSTGIDPGQQTRRGDPPRKQTLACHFCRERKIACGRPVPGSHDGTCNQCARRNLLCTYPTESRRGQHKRKTPRTRDTRLLL